MSQTPKNNELRINPIYDQPDPSGDGTKMQLIEQLSTASSEDIPEILAKLKATIRTQRQEIRAQALHNLMQYREALRAILSDTTTPQRDVLRGQLQSYMDVIDQEEKAWGSAIDEGTQRPSTEKKNGSSSS